MKNVKQLKPLHIIKLEVKKILGTPNNITKSDIFNNTQLCGKLLRLYLFFTVISQTLLKLTEIQRHSIIICFQHWNNKLHPR